MDDMVMGGTKPNTFTEGQRKTLSSFLQAHEPFRNIRQTMPMQYVIAFLLVALDEGQNVRHYAKKSGISASVMSRHLLDLGPQLRDRSPGYGLLQQQPDPMDLREHQYFLAPKGSAVAHSILRALER